LTVVQHRTGCVIGIVRKLSGWDLGNIISEYKTYADPKVRECDINYITGFELANISNLFRLVNWPFRTTRFLRAATFVVVMLVVWILSGHTIAGDRIVAASERELLNED
jgi:tyrosine-protein phosphatase SIW14